MSFYAYMLRSRDGSYYVGHTDNLEARLSQHRDGLVPGYTAQDVRFDSFGVRAFPQEMRLSLANGESRAGPESRKKR